MYGNKQIFIQLELRLLTFIIYPKLAASISPETKWNNINNNI